MQVIVKTIQLTDVKRDLTLLQSEQTRDNSSANGISWRAVSTIGEMGMYVKLD